MKRNRPLILLAVAGLFIGCDRGGSTHAYGELPTTTLTVGQTTLTLEIADEPEELSKGLMYRTHMPPDHGMIFVFPDEAYRSFWMKNTNIPLDIIFVNDAGEVVSVHQMQPHDLNQTISKGEARFAIELNQGRAEALGIKAGDKLELPDVVRAAPAAN